jgi:hypothetical protein
MEFDSDEQQQALYDITNGIRDYLYRSFPNYEGVQYPCIVTGLTGLNISLDEKRWNDVDPLEVWVVEVTPDMISEGEAKTKLFISPMLKIGYVKKDGHLEYHDTNKSLLAAANDLKQKHGCIKAPNGLQPVLSNPFTRYRISYGSEPNRPNYDFLWGDPAATTLSRLIG